MRRPLPTGLQVHDTLGHRAAAYALPTHKHNTNRAKWLETAGALIGVYDDCGAFSRCGGGTSQHVKATSFEQQLWHISMGLFKKLKT